MKDVILGVRDKAIAIANYDYTVEVRLKNPSITRNEYNCGR